MLDLELLRMSAHNVAIAGATKTSVELDTATFGPAQLLQRLPQHCIEGLKVRVGLEGARNHADAPHPVGLLRACRQRQGRRAAEKRYELAPSYAEHATFRPFPRHRICDPSPIHFRAAAMRHAVGSWDRARFAGGSQPNRL
jgi:hypothetical protein